MKDTLICIGSAAGFIRGIVNFIPTREIINWYGEISADSRKNPASASLATGRGKVI